MTVSKLALGAYIVPFDAIRHIIAVIKLDSEIGLKVDRNGIVLPEEIDKYISEYEECVLSLDEEERQVVKSFFSGVSK